MNTAAKTMKRIEAELPHWQIPLMDFVDDLRFYRDAAAIAEPFTASDPRFAALLAATIEALCRELGWKPPTWLNDVRGLPEPWFVSGFQSLKAIALAESPVWFRMRNVFVLANFLVRV